MISSIDDPGPSYLQKTQKIRALAKEMESLFLAEMLKHSGFGEARENFGGGIGEAQFADFLRQEHAQSLADRGGIGIAENIFKALEAYSNGY
ncbi:MAG: rod-binding protein [Pseudomonadota bacterium]